MHGLGTIVNFFAIIAGGVIGMVFGNLFTERFQSIIMMACGLSTVFIGLSGALAGLLNAEGGVLRTQGTFLLIASLTGGSLLGEFLRIEDRLESFGEWLKQKTGNARDASFVNAFITATLTVCIGAMAVVGSIEDGLEGNHSILFTKAILDFVIILIMSASLGKGCAFSAIPVGIFQGSITAVAGLLAPVITDRAMGNLSTVGSVLIFCVGLNLMFGKRVKVANMLPALLIAALWRG